MGWLKRNFWPVNIEKERVSGELEHARLRLRKVDSGDNRDGAATAGRSKTLREIRQKHLDLAEEAITSGEYFSAWGHLLAFNRDMIEDMHGVELEARLASARAEALLKLPSWRGEAVTALLTMESSANEQEKQDRLREILFHLHTSSQNTYFKIAKLKNQTFAVIWMLLIASATVFSLSFLFMSQPFFDEISRSHFHLAMLSGLVGSVLSVAFSVIRTNPEQKIPELKVSFPLTWARSFFGPLVAFALLVIIETDLINLGGYKPESLVGLSFVAGFSERWFLNLVDSVQDRAGV